VRCSEAKAAVLKANAVAKTTVNRYLILALIVILNDRLEDVSAEVKLKFLFTTK
jgi:hypothetical protein